MVFHVYTGTDFLAKCLLTDHKVRESLLGLRTTVLKNFLVFGYKYDCFPIEILLFVDFCFWRNGLFFAICMFRLMF